MKFKVYNVDTTFLNSILHILIDLKRITLLSNEQIDWQVRT